MVMARDFERIVCPNCKGDGYVFESMSDDASLIDCPVCDRRGILIIDHVRTADLPPRQRRK